MRFQALAFDVQLPEADHKNLTKKEGAENERFQILRPIIIIIRIIITTAIEMDSKPIQQPVLRFKPLSSNSPPVEGMSDLHGEETY